MMPDMQVKGKQGRTLHPGFKVFAIGGLLLGAFFYYKFYFVNKRKQYRRAATEREINDYLARRELKIATSKSNESSSDS